MSGGLHVNNLSHAYDGLPIVSGVSVFVAPGEVVCLLGPSGCGKTTLLRVAAGLEVLQRGQIHIGERIVADGVGGMHVPPENRGIGLMFQDYALFPHLNVFENIVFGLPEPNPERIRWVDQALEQMDLTACRQSYPHTLSGGQQQRVALLRAMAPEPRVLFLDEPFSGLDTTRRARVREQTLQLLKETGVATLMVTHDPDEAMFMADRILVMNDGRVVQDGAPVEIYFEPVNGFVTALLGPVNRLDGTVEDGHVATPLGTFDANGIDNGTAVQILIRPDGIRLTLPATTPPSDSGDAPRKPALAAGKSGNSSVAPAFRVVSARPLGRSSHVVITGHNPSGSEILIEARVPGVFLPEPGCEITVSVNAREAYVFAAD
ncbi:MAG: ABC transporter ATP-binding protein [Pseudomonadota bacterium]|nr:ABC transporter ATP-binding protein [Pseudomonadota bacterium]